MKKLSYLLLGLLSISFAVSCSDEDDKETKTAYETADAGKGGIMYDKFWAAEARDWTGNANLTKLNASSDFFRCKQCHGWDLKGSFGSYINRGPKTNRPNVSGSDLFMAAKTKTADQLFAAMKQTTGRRDIAYDLATYDPATNAVEGDKMPNYNQLLTDAEIWDIVKFMKEGAIDVNLLYTATYTGTYPTGKATFTEIGKDGSEAAGLAIYEKDCKSCHGADGRTLTMESMSAGQFTRSKPNEVQHKVKFGQLGSTMKGHFTYTPQQMKDLYKALANSTTFPNM